MQKWFPEPFAPAAAAAAGPSGAVFRANAGAADADGAVTILQFRRETGYTDPRALLGTLTREERADLYELAEQDVAAAYEQRLADQARENEARLAQAKQEFADRFTAWTEGVERALRDDLAAAAAGAARLALQVAGKIVRDTVAVDHGALTRAIETVLFRQQQAAPLQVQVSPADALWLADQPQLRERLNVQVVVADRRLSDGDCRVRAGAREWDLTIDGQLAVLGEILGEVLETNHDDDPPAGNGGAHGPGLD